MPTKIEWTDETWNPVRGCSRVSEGCRNCYAEGVAKRFSGPGQPFEGLVRIGADGKAKAEWSGKIKFVEEHLLDPLKWRKPRRVFVNSVSDLFHEGVTDEQLDQIFAVMALSPQHTFQVLTKRPERMLKYFRMIEDEKDTQRWINAAYDSIPDLSPCAAGAMEDAGWPLANVWLGVSVENQKAADERIPLLLQTPAAVRFISAEPLLGPIFLPRKVHLPRAVRSDIPFGPALLAPNGHHTAVSNPQGALAVPCEGGKLLGIKPGEFENCGTALDWVICGGESGPHARPMHPDWARWLRDQCKAAGVPFFFKQWGEWYGFTGKWVDTDMWDRTGLGVRWPIHVWPEHVTIDSAASVKCGKKLAGDKLDHRPWHQFPGGCQ